MLFLLVVASRFCNQDQIEISLPPIPSNLASIGSVRTAKTERIRIVIDTSQIFDRSDKLMCKYVGQKISWAEANGTCQEYDILSESRLRAMNETINNVVLFYEKMIRVVPLEHEIELDSIIDVNIPKKNVSGDIHITYVVRPYSPGFAPQASTYIAKLSSLDFRPVTSLCILNAKEIPNEAQDVNSVVRDFFELVLHEMMHSLGIKSQLFKYWINPVNNRPYGDDLPITKYKNNENGTKVVHILHTPKAQEVIKRRFGVSKFPNGVPAGIELEDAGGSGTSMSHPKGRVYYSEVLAGISMRKSYISEISLAMLSDTGWYDVNESFAELYPWGDGYTLSTGPLSSFPVGPPHVVFPKHYLCSPGANPYRCHYDYSGPAICSQSQRINCSDPALRDNMYCADKDFYNPDNQEVIGTSPVFDYQFVMQPYKLRQCSDISLNSEEKRSQGELYSNSSKCALSTLLRGNNSIEIFPRCFKMSCNQKKQLFIHVGNESALCSTAGSKVTFKGYAGHVECPNPNHICPLLLSRDQQSTDEQKKKMYLLIVSLSMLIILGVSIGVMLIYCYSLRVKAKMPPNVINIELDV